MPGHDRNLHLAFVLPAVDGFNFQTVKCVRDLRERCHNFIWGCGIAPHGPSIQRNLDPSDAGGIFGLDPDSEGVPDRVAVRRFHKADLRPFQFRFPRRGHGSRTPTGQPHEEPQPCHKSNAIQDFFSFRTLAEAAFRAVFSLPETFSLKEKIWSPVYLDRT